MNRVVNFECARVVKTLAVCQRSPSLRYNVADFVRFKQILQNNDSWEEQRELYNAAYASFLDLMVKHTLGKFEEDKTSLVNESHRLRSLHQKLMNEHQFNVRFIYDDSDCIIASMIDVPYVEEQILHVLEMIKLFRDDIASALMNHRSDPALIHNDGYISLMSYDHAWWDVCKLLKSRLHCLSTHSVHL